MKTIKISIFLIFGMVFSVSSLLAQETTIPSMIQEAQKSVVSIQSDCECASWWTGSRSFLGLYLKHYYEEDVLKNGKIMQSAAGSGVFVDASGLVLTNEHVIRDARAIKVVTYDHQEYEAVLLGKSQEHDLALLQIQPVSAVRAIPFGEAAGIRAGQDVFALGAPLGFKQTVTKGIVSGINRELKRGNRVVMDQLIQTDVASNPGNSGGPLLNSDGKMLGVMVAGYGPGQGINFAVPIEVIEKVIPEMQKNLEHTRRSLKIFARYGMILQEVKEAGRSFVVVQTVTQNSQAFQAGVREKDVIVKFHKRSPIPYIKSFMDEDKKIKTGERIYMSFQRDQRKYFTYLEAA